MKRFFQFIILWAAFSSAFCQNHELDSLKVIIKESVVDSVRIEAYDILVRRSAFKFPDTSRLYGFKGIELAMNKGDLEAAASLSLNTGTSFYAQGLYDDAKKYWQQAADLSQETADQAILPLALNNVAVIYQNTGKIEQAIEQFSNAVEIYKSRNDTARVGRGTFNIGKAYVALGKDSVGLQYLRESISIYKQLNPLPYKNLANAYNEIATVHYYDDLYSVALENFQQSVTYYEMGGDSLGSTKPLGNMANIYKDLKDHDQAKGIYKEIIRLRETKKQFSVHFNYHNLAGLYREIGEFDSALTYGLKALELRNRVGLEGYKSSTAILLGRLFKDWNKIDSANKYYRMAYFLAKDLDDAHARMAAICSYGIWEHQAGNDKIALPLLEDCYAIAQKANSRKMLVDASNSLHEIHYENGQLGKAYLYLSEANQLSDSLFNADLVREVTQLEANFRHEKELLKRQGEIEVLEAREEVSRLRIALVVGIASLFIIIGFFVARTRVKNKGQEARRLKEIGDFKEAMTGMVAHDLKNPLSAIINSKGELENKQVASQMLRLVNNMLDVHKFESTKVKLNKQDSSVSELLKAGEAQVSYLLKEKNIQLKSVVDDVVLSIDKEMLERVIVNLLTNAIKYSPLNGVVWLKAEILNNLIKISVSDQGKGISPDQYDLIFKSFGQVEAKSSGGVGSTGLGLTFVKLAVEAHGSSIQVDSEVGKGTIFSFELPINSVKQNDTKIEELADGFVIPKSARKSISKQVKALKAYNLHQIGEIEDELSEIKKKQDEVVNEWVESVLNAAYSGNKIKYDELIKEAEL